MLVSVCLLAALVAGCGSGGGTTEGSPTEGPPTTDTNSPLNRKPIISHPTLSKSGFLRLADQICSYISTEIEEGFERFAQEHQIEGREPTKQEAREIGEEIVVPLVFRQFRELTNLGEVPRVEAETQKILDAFEEGINEGKEHPDRAATEPARLFAKANRLAKAYGLSECVRDESLAG